MSSKKITIKDLCPEDKKKIGELLKKLSNETVGKRKTEAKSKDSSKTKSKTNNDSDK